MVVIVDDVVVGSEFFVVFVVFPFVHVEGLISVVVLLVVVGAVLVVVGAVLVDVVVVAEIPVAACSLVVSFLVVVGRCLVVVVVVGV